MFSLPRLFAARLLVATLVFPPVAAVGEISDAEADLETALASLEHQAELTQGWIVEFTTDMKVRDSADAPVFRQTMRCVERRLGDKYDVEQEEVSKQDSKDRWFQRRAFDGVRQMTFYELDRQGGINSSDRHVTHFGPSIYSGIQPFPGVLREWERLQAPAWVTRGGRRLLSVKLKNPKSTNGHECEILLDPAQAWQPAEYTSTAFVEPNGTKETSKWGESRYQYSKYHREGEICIPTQMQMTTDIVEPNGKRFRHWETVVNVTSIQINPDLSKETFAIDFPDGTQVNDMDRQVMYIAGRPGSEKRMSGSVAGGPPGAVVNPALGPWWSDYRLWIALSVVFIAGALWWRWREQH